MFVKINTDAYQDYFFGFTLMTVFVINIFSAILSGGLFGIAGMVFSIPILAILKTTFVFIRTKTKNAALTN